MSLNRSIRWLAAATAVLVTVSCSSIVPGNGIEDLKAIHNPEDWTPKSPANLSASPTSYEVGRRLEGLEVNEQDHWFQISDHRAFELELLDKISETNPLETRMAVEATSVLIIELLHDDYSEAKVRSAAILSTFAGSWVERAGVRLQDVDPDIDLAQAVNEYVAAVNEVNLPDYQENVGKALDRIDRASIPDAVTGARLLVGMARSLEQSPLTVTGQKVVQSTGVRTILMALEQGMKDGDPDVADQCRVRYDLILKYVKS